MRNNCRCAKSHDFEPATIKKEGKKERKSALKYQDFVFKLGYNPLCQGKRTF